MVLTDGLPIWRTMLDRVLDRIDEGGLIARQRLDAVNDAGRCRRVRNGGETIDAALSPIVVGVIREFALIGRAMHQHLGAEIGGEGAQTAHHFDGARSLRVVGAGDRKPGRRAQEIMQAVIASP